MKALRRFVRRLAASVLGRRDDDRVREELAEHLTRRLEDYARAGLPLDEARRRARLDLGTDDATIEAYRDEQRLRGLEDTWQDIRYAFRIQRRDPGLAAVAILSIGLGIGATSTMFTLVDRILLRPLPVEQPDELVQITLMGLRFGSNRGDATELSHPMFRELADGQRVFDGVFARFDYPLHVTHAGRTERVEGEMVSGSYFLVLGVGAALGRTLTPADDRAPGAHPVAVLSHAYWVSGFGADADVLGRTAIINGHPYTIVGVARQGFDGVQLGRPTRVFVPMMMKAQLTPGWNALDERLNRWVRVFARLGPRVTRTQAEAALQPLFASVLERDLEDPGFGGAPSNVRQQYRDNRLVLLPAAQGRSAFREAITTPLWVLMATAAGVLLIACTNVANLLLARSATRQREIAARLALGATRSRVVRQLLVESVVLALAGGAAGLALAASAPAIVLGFFVRPEGPQPISTLPDWRILAFTFAVSTATGLLFGLAPALQSTRPHLLRTLKPDAGSIAGGHARLRQALVASQIAVSFLLLVAAVLFVRTLDNLIAVDVGFDTSRILTFGMDPSLNGYDPGRARAVVSRFLETLNGTPGVDAAGLASMRVLEGTGWSSDLAVEGDEGKQDEQAEWCNAVSPGYFRAMGMRILAGRDFDLRDVRLAPAGAGGSDYRVAIVNESFARHYFGAASALGRRIGFDRSPGAPLSIEVVGIVADAKYTDVRTDVPRQVFFAFLEGSAVGAFTMYVRTTQPADRMFSDVRRAVAEIDPALPVHTLRTLEQQVGQSLRRERLLSAMTTAFGVLATLLAVVGLYGVMSYAVSRRTREIGVRVALGARGRDIGWLVIRDALRIAVVGIALGVPLAWWLGRSVSTQLYGVEPTDVATFAGAGLLLGGTALVAGLVPSVRAARIEVTSALRHE